MGAVPLLPPPRPLRRRHLPYAPSLATPRLHIWTACPTPPASLQRPSSRGGTTLRPPSPCSSWSSPFLSTIPAGPVFLATWSANSSTTPAAADTSLSGSDTGTTAVSAAVSAVSTHKLSADKTAAAVLPLPLPLFAPHLPSRPPVLPSALLFIHPIPTSPRRCARAFRSFPPQRYARSFLLPPRSRPPRTLSPIFGAPCRPFLVDDVTHVHRSLSHHPSLLGPFPSSLHTPLLPPSLDSIHVILTTITFYAARSSPPSRRTPFFPYLYSASIILSLIFCTPSLASHLSLLLPLSPRHPFPSVPLSLTSSPPFALHCPPLPSSIFPSASPSLPLLRLFFPSYPSIFSHLRSPTSTHHTNLLFS
ncbi:hypothetical protein C8R44DRAFT_873798 [Mycena epipterygia]|nr:hypothetical protein C8R44DRAFT_873798 [Mycena epipterygia]